MKGTFVLPLADDFDAPLEDFEDYLTLKQRQLPRRHIPLPQIVITEMTSTTQRHQVPRAIILRVTIPMVNL